MKNLIESLCLKISKVKSLNNSKLSQLTIKWCQFLKINLHHHRERERLFKNKLIVIYIFVITKCMLDDQNIGSQICFLIKSFHKLDRLIIIIWALFL